MSIQNRSVIVRRLWALIIDGVCAYGIALALTWFDYMSPIRVILPIVLLLFRDIYKQSLGKTIMKLRVIDISTMQRAQLKYRILRQITLLVAPFEIVACLITRGLRLTDIWCGTKVVSATDVPYIN